MRADEIIAPLYWHYKHAIKVCCATMATCLHAMSLRQIHLFDCAMSQECGVEIVTLFCRQWWWDGRSRPRSVLAPTQNSSPYTWWSHSDDANDRIRQRQHCFKCDLTTQPQHPRTARNQRGFPDLDYVSRATSISRRTQEYWNGASFILQLRYVYITVHEQLFVPPVTCKSVFNPKSQPVRKPFIMGALNIQHLICF